MRAPCPAHLILLDLATVTISDKNKNYYFHPHVNSSPLAQNVHLNTLLSNASHVGPFLMRDKVLCSYKTE